jgi:hypothetical protein
MATRGAWTLFDRSLLKLQDGTILLPSHSFKAVLLAATQSISASFVGASADGRYADLTAELATASGYTVGGVALTSVSVARATATEAFFTGAFGWTLSGSISIKYVAIFSDTAANDDLLCFMDLDTGGGTESPTTGPLTFTPDSTYGIFKWNR